ncbi:MAG TPA: NADPH-dependent FMN reductase [Rubellimicrobium sp.]|nr:NADPH-dependent FMN reductase [Rubellimicrobium sp.]
MAISGSLRAASSNSRLVEALAQVAPHGIDVRIYRGLRALPHFDLDLDGETPPPEVAELRREVGAAKGLIICSPEYAHGVPGSLKNALDWLVPSLEFPGKPVALIATSAHARFAPAQLRETLATMSGDVIEAASITMPLGPEVSTQDILDDPARAGALRSALLSMAGAVEA